MCFTFCQYWKLSNKKTVGHVENLDKTSRFLFHCAFFIQSFIIIFSFLHSHNKSSHRLKVYRSNFLNYHWTNFLHPLIHWSDNLWSGNFHRSAGTLQILWNTFRASPKDRRIEEKTKKGIFCFFFTLPNFVGKSYFPVFFTP